jgi:outer membrane protein W
MVRGFAEDVNTSSLDVSFAGSNTLFGQYYFNNNNFRPFVGVGFGLFNVASASVSSANGGEVYEAIDESKFGFYPRVGFDAGHFTLSLDYNLVGASTSKSTSSNNTIESKNSYIGIRLGGFFGGGRK